MNVKARKIEVDAKTADLLETTAAARGVSVAELVAELARAEEISTSSLNEMRAAGRGPWAPAVLAEDARRLAEFDDNGEGVPWEEVEEWMRSWGTPHELPAPKPRKL